MAIYLRAVKSNGLTSLSKNRSQMAQGCVMSYGAGVRHELWRTPPLFFLIYQYVIFFPSYDLLGGQKVHACSIVSARQ